MEIERFKPHQPHSRSNLCGYDLLSKKIPIFSSTLLSCITEVISTFSTGIAYSSQAANQHHSSCLDLHTMALHHCRLVSSLSFWQICLNVGCCVAMYFACLQLLSDLYSPLVTHGSFLLYKPKLSYRVAVLSIKIATS